jgi:hypothetical protein
MSFGATILATVLGDLSTPEDTDGAANAIAEGADVNTPVGIAVSVDSTPAATYSLVGDTSEGGFKIDLWTGVVTVADPSRIDFESAPGHIYTITVRATKNNNFSSEQTFTISVNDVAPSTPVDSNAAANSVLEGAANGTAVGVTASATDVNGPGVTWSLIGDTSAGGFTINAATGVITVADGTKIDYESSAGHAYTVTAQASDGTLTSSRAFTINVGDVAPTTPVDANAAANSVTEGAANGTAVGITASAADPNGPATTYSLTNNAGGRFAINATTGVVTVANGAAIDFETAAGHGYGVTVQATSGATSTTQTFSIGVTDVGPSTPTDTNGAGNSVFEGAANGTAVGITASSADPGGGPAPTYALTDSVGGRFAINATTGVVTVANGAAIDFETAPGHAYGITVQATAGALSNTQTFAIGVGNVNEAPAGTDKLMPIAEDTPYTFSVADFGFTDPSDSSAPNSLQAVKITTLPGAGAGTLTNSGNPVNAGDFISAADIAAGHLVFTPVLNANGFPEATFTFQVQDNGGTASGVDLDQSANTFSINVVPVNDAPVNSIPGTQSVNEEATLTFSTGTGNAITISDVDVGSGNETVTLTVTSGTLALGSTAGLTSFTNNAASITLTGTVANINAALNGLTYTGNLNFNGADSLSISTSDNGNTGGGGTQSDNDSVTINVAPVNDAPAGTDKAVLIAEDTTYTFSTADFGFSDPSDSIAPNSLQAVRMTTVPGAGAGTLTNNGVTVNAGDSVLASAIAAGQLVFTPALDATGSPLGTFTFQVQDNGGTANSGVDLDQSANTFTINVNAGNDAPINSVPGTQSVNEEATLTFSTGTGNAISISDVDVGSGNEIVTLSVAGGALTLNGTAGLVFTTGDGSADSTMTFSGTVAAINTALNGLTYTGNLNFNGADTLVVSTNDNGNTGNGGPKNDSDNVTINVAAVNDVPVATATGGSTAYIENAAAVTIDGLLTVTDPDSSMVSAQVRVSANFQAGDSLNFLDQNGITGSYAPGTGVLALGGTTTVANYQAALRSITFSSTNNDPGVSKTIEFKVNDGLVDSNLATKTLAVTPVNDEPTLTATANGGGAVTFTETSAPTFPGSGAVDLFNTPNASTVEAGQTVTQVVITVTNVADTIEFLTVGATAVDLVNGNSEGVTVGGAAGTAAVSIVGGTATITVTPTTTFSAANVNALVDSLAYNNDDDTPTATTHTISVTSLTDSGANGGGNGDDNTGSPSVSTVVTVTPTNDAPTGAQDFTFNGASSAIGNTSLVLDDGTGPAAPDPAGPQKTISGSLLAGATDPDGPNALTTVAVTNQATAHGHVTISTGGEFSYAPTAGYVGIDSFNYTVTDGNTPTAGTDTGSVTITISTPRVWYVNADAATDGDGTSANPFNTLTHFNNAGDNVDGPGDTIFLYNATAHYTSGLTLENNEKLIGQNQGLTVNGTALEPAAGPNNAIIDGGLVLGSGDTLSGVTLGNTGAGTALSGTNFGTLRIDHVVVNTDNNGIILDTGAFEDASFNSVSAAGATDVSLTDVTGNVDFGTGSMSGQFAVSGGTVNTKYSGNLSQANNAAMLDVSGGHSGDLIFDTGTLSATNGTGLQFDNADGSYSFIKPYTLNGGDAGIDIVNESNGTFNFLATGTITNPSGVAFNVNGSNASIQYHGDIAKNTDGQTVSVQNFTGVILFSGSVSSTGVSDGINLANNTNAVISFSSRLEIDTSASNTTGFSATGGGTVKVSQHGSIGNTINSGQGTALKVADTTIGTGGLTFRSISSNGGSANGIILDHTGSAGGLHVVGNGGAGTGGTIANKTGADASFATVGTGIYLNNTSDLQLDRMNLHDFQNFGIRGISVDGFSLANSTVNATASASAKNGTTDAANEASVKFGTDDGITNGLTGTASINNTTIGDGFENNFEVNNHTGSLNLTVFGSTFGDTSTASPGNAGLRLQADGNANITGLIMNSSFLENRSKGIHVVNQGSGAVDVDIGEAGVAGSGGTFTDNGIAMDIDQNGSGTLNFNIVNATVSNPNYAANFGGGGAGSPIKIAMGGAAGPVERGAFTGNIIGNNLNNNGSGTGPGIEVVINGTDNTGGNTATIKIDNNIVSNIANFGIHVLNGDGNATVNATITNNTVTTVTAAALQAIRVDAGATSSQTGAPGVADNGTLNLDVHGNNSLTVDPTAGVTDIRIRQLFNGIFKLEGYVGSPTDDAAVAAYVSSQNGGNTAVADHSNTGFQNIAAVPEPPAPLLAAAGGIQASSPTPGVTSLSQAQLDSVVTAAIAQWAAAGASGAQLAALAALTFSVRDLAGDRVADHTDGHIVLDVNAAGHGWFVDPTPGDNSEFAYAANAAGTDLFTDPAQAAAGHLDLLTAVSHEMGHELGIPDSTAASDVNDLMYISLVDGERRVPDAADVAESNAANAQFIEAALPLSAQAAAGTPIVAGTAGNDTIDAGHGGSILFGGAGADNFVFGPSIQLNTTPAQITHVADYSAAQGDTFDFSALTSAFHNSSVSDALVVRAVEDASGKFATLQVDHIDPMGLPSAPNWVSVAQLDGAHAGDAVNVWIDNHSVHLAQIHVDLLV